MFTGCVLSVQVCMKACICACACRRVCVCACVCACVLVHIVACTEGIISADVCNSFRDDSTNTLVHNSIRLIPVRILQARKYLEKLILQQPVTINPTFRLPDGSGQFAHVFIDPVGSLSQDLIEKGFATVKPVSMSGQCCSSPTCIRR